mmetsp:Transcript_40440/g.119933  ORF Transcript_40440/g.119933 Transcript_40440/m.119933 type:complete len:179 (-) Transcript_40440:164-700(-)
MQERMSQEGPGQLVSLLCCWWLPLLFVLGAGGVHKDCEAENFKTWMMVFGVVPWAAQMLINLVATCFAYYGWKFAFKMALRFTALVGLLSVVLLVWGYVEYAKTNEDCVSDDADINPRALALFQLALSGAVLPCIPCVVCMLLRNVWSPTEKPGEHAPEGEQAPEVGGTAFGKLESEN